MTVAFVCRLPYRSPVSRSDMVEAILDGRQAKGLRLAEMLRNGPLGWDEQRSVWGARPRTRSADERSSA